MRFKAVMTASVGLLMLGSAAAYAEAKVYPFHSKENFCPAGLMPVTIDGTICCGTPNQTMSYQSVKAHGAAKKRRAHRVKAAAADCPIGQKGCNFN